MSESIQSLIQAGTKLWLDSIDPQLVKENKAMGATGATSNPIIVSDLLQSGRYDAMLQELSATEQDDETIAWAMTHQLVAAVQQEFLDIWSASAGNDGYVSFELDPLLEDPQNDLPHDDRVARYIQLGQHWSANQENRMIKVPATPAGIDALEDLAAAGVPLNVTLIFSMRQYQQARDAVLRGAQRRGEWDRFKSVYSIFVSRIDVYTEKHCGQLSGAAQGLVGIFNAQRIWLENQKFWSDFPCQLDQEIIFASTGTKKATDDPWKYVAALAGSDIQTNPPQTNAAVASSGLAFTRKVDQFPSDSVIQEIDSVVDFEHMEATLMREGIAKFAEPHKALIAMITEKRKSLARA